MSRVIAVVQARMGSTRLPGKVLMDVGGIPALELMLTRLKAAPLDQIVVATSRQSQDDPVSDLVSRLGIKVVRGPEEDVLGRYALAIQRHPAEYVVRLTADCPLIDPGIVDMAISLARRHDADYVSNTLIRTYPDGLDVEVCKSSALMEAARDARDPEEREHVTPYIYRRTQHYVISVLRQSDDLSHERWTVDYPEDLARIRKVVAHFGARRDFTWEEAHAVLGSRPSQRNGFYLRTANEQDVSYILSLQASPAVRLAGTDESTSARLTKDSYATLLYDCRHRVWVAELDGVRVGAIRMDIEEGIGTLWVVVGSATQGHELGSTIIRSLQHVTAAGYQVQQLRAPIPEVDESSLRLFESNGFTRIEQDEGLVTLGWQEANAQG